MPVVGAEAPTVEELRSYLRTRLPEPQMPWAIVLVEELPLTPSGRVSWEGLPRVAGKAAHVAPRTEVEKTLAAIWCELLQVQQIGIQENFFRLGGNSLLATQAVSRINEAFQVNFGVEILFRHTTIVDLAIATDEQLMAQLGDEDLQALLSDSETF